MRLKIGHKYQITRTVGASAAVAGTAAAVAASVAANGLTDVEPKITAINPKLDPLPVTVTIPTYSISTHNELESLTCIAFPVGGPVAEPTTAEGWMACGCPMQTISLAPGAVATVAVAPSNPAVAAVIAATSATAPAVAGATVNPPVVAGTTPAGGVLPAVTPTYLPGPTGGTATFELALVPAGPTSIQMIENYVN
jgi:hypothetical protein